MSNEILTFSDVDIENDKFCRYKNPIFLEDVGIQNVLVSNDISSSKKNQKTINNLLVTCMLITKLSCYI